MPQTHMLTYKTQKHRKHTHTNTRARAGTHTHAHTHAHAGANTQRLTPREFFFVVVSRFVVIRVAFEVVVGATVLVVVVVPGAVVLGVVVAPSQSARGVMRSTLHTHMPQIHMLTYKAQKHTHARTHAHTHLNGLETVPETYTVRVYLR